MQTPISSGGLVLCHGTRGKMPREPRVPWCATGPVASVSRDPVAILPQVPWQSPQCAAAPGLVSHGILWNSRGKLATGSTGSVEPVDFKNLCFGTRVF